MKWMTDDDKEVKGGWKTATCPKCGNRRPVSRFRFKMAKKLVPGSISETYPVEIIRDCDLCR